MAQNCPESNALSLPLFQTTMKGASCHLSHDLASTISGAFCPGADKRQDFFPPGRTPEIAVLPAFLFPPGRCGGAMSRATPCLVLPSLW